MDRDILPESYVMSVRAMMFVHRAIPAHGTQSVVLTCAALVHTRMSVRGKVCPTSGAVPIAWVIGGRKLAQL